MNILIHKKISQLGTRRCLSDILEECGRERAPRLQVSRRLQRGQAQDRLSLQVRTRRFFVGPRFNGKITGN